MSMYWNHRVMHDPDNGLAQYSFVEVYGLDEDRLLGYSEPHLPQTSSLVELKHELQADFENMMRALHKPTLSPDDFKGED